MQLVFADTIVHEESDLNLSRENDVGIPVICRKRQANGVSAKDLFVGLQIL
jgi:hypothetical protein